MSADTLKKQLIRTRMDDMFSNNMLNACIEKSNLLGKNNDEFDKLTASINAANDGMGIGINSVTTLMLACDAMLEIASTYETVIGSNDLSLPVLTTELVRRTVEKHVSSTFCVWTDEYCRLVDQSNVSTGIAAPSYIKEGGRSNISEQTLSRFVQTLKGSDILNSQLSSTMYYLGYFAKAAAVTTSEKSRLFMAGDYLKLIKILTYMCRQIMRAIVTVTSYEQEKMREVINNQDADRNSIERQRAVENILPHAWPSWATTVREIILVPYYEQDGGHVSFLAKHILVEVGNPLKNNRKHYDI